MKKKMKNLFSKITVLVLIVAMLIPFTTIPKVEAEETSSDCEYHTNYYFFLEANNPHGWVNAIANGDNGREYESYYYTSFLYNFPYDGRTIEFDEANSGIVEITDDSDFEKDFIPDYDEDEWTAGQFYYEYTKEGNGAAGDYQSYSYTNDSDGKNKENSIVTYLYHGPWAHAGDSTSSGTISLNSSGKLNFITGGVELDKDDVEEYVDATIFLTNDASLSNIKIGIGTQTGSTGSYDYSFNKIKNAIAYFNESEGNPKADIAVSMKNNEPVISLLITRKYEIDNIFDANAVSNHLGMNLSSARVSGDGKGGLALTTDSSGVADFANSHKGRLYFPTDDEKSSSYISSAEVEVTYEDDGTTIKSQAISGSNKYLSQQTSYYGETNYETYNAKNGTHWFFAPSLYKIAYKVCKTGNTTTTEDTVTVTYDGNASDVSNVPSADTIKKGNDYVVSSKEPTRSGYTFKNWNTDKECSSNGKIIEPEAKIENLQNNTTLYACWGATGTTDAKGTGVLTYAGLFTGVIALAGGAYYLVKKKNLFKKI